MKFKLTLALLLAPLPALAAGCGAQDFVAQRQAISQAEFSLDGVTLRDADLPLLTPDAGVDLNVRLTVKNPNAVTARLDRLDYELFMEGAKIGEGATATDFSVPAGATDVLVIPLHVPYQGLPGLAMEALTRREANFRLKGVTHLDTPFGRLDYPIELEHKATL